MKRLLSIILIVCLVAACALFALACGNKDDNGDPDATDAPGVTGEAQPGTNDGVGASAAPGSTGEGGSEGNDPAVNTPDPAEAGETPAPGTTDGTGEPNTTDGTGESGSTEDPDSASLIEDDGNIIITIPSGQGSGGLGGGNP